MKILVIGGGGREHALAWKLAQSALARTVFVAPGNGGTAQAGGKLRNLAEPAVNDIAALAAWAQAQQIALSVVGPEAPLAAGLVDAFRARGLPVVGPTQAAARLESSKAFAKDFMQRHGIPTARYAVFDDAQQAHAYIRAHGAPIVIKADGLAAGKGVVVAASADEAHAAVDAMRGTQGNQGTRIVIEECLQGEEASFIVLCDGRSVLPLASSQDHKRLRDGDRGPNTGGMGAYSPAPVVTPAIHARIMREIILPAVDGMQKDGTPYTGFLYAGVMIDAHGAPRTLEFNCRLGDPETQPILLRLQSDLLVLLLAAAQGQLHGQELQWDSRSALGVVLAAAGYPDAPRTGDRIGALPAAAPDALVFHAATQQNADGTLVASGGRVLCATALGADLAAARQKAYALVQASAFDGAQWRSDIGWRALSP